MEINREEIIELYNQIKKEYKTLNRLKEEKKDNVIEGFLVFDEDKSVKWNKEKCEEYKFIKESDNLEDLMDEFVFFDKNFNTYGVFDKKVINYKWLKDNRTIYPSKWCIIYGAIWTNKGLKFVAKMNENGELEMI